MGFHNYAPSHLPTYISPHMPLLFSTHMRIGLHCYAPSQARTCMSPHIQSPFHPRVITPSNHLLTFDWPPKVGIDMADEELPAKAPKRSKQKGGQTAKGHKEDDPHVLAQARKLAQEVSRAKNGSPLQKRQLGCTCSR